KSLIALPAEGATLNAGNQTVQGVAFSGNGAITRVEVSVDDGQNWESAIVDRAKAPGAWQRWKFEWRAKPGKYVLVARATDSNGDIQPRDPQWNSGGYLYNAWDSVRCGVRS